MLGTSFIEFKLDYSAATKNLRIDRSIGNMKNEMFAGGHTWSIVCYPRGVRRDQSDINDGAPSLTTLAKSSSKITTTGTGTWMACQSMKRSEIESGCHVDVDGCVTFVCGLIDLNSSDRRIPVPPSDLGSHLGHLLHLHSADGDGDGDGDGYGDGADVSFSVAGETFHAHRAILAARSPVFKAQLLGAMADAKMDSITLHDIQPAAFRVLLQFVYTDELPSELVKDDLDVDCSSITDLLQHLLASADMYQMDRLKLMCAQKLWDRVSPETVAAMLVCAETHGCPELKKWCIDFFVVDKNFKSAVLTEGYSRLIQGFPSVIEEIRVRLALEP